MAKDPWLNGAIAVAGHVCLDVIPRFASGSTSPVEFKPGSLIHVGPALQSTGGAVANTGLALHRLGLPVRLIGKVGDDLFGHEIIRLFRQEGPSLAEHMICVPGEHTSYSIVLNPPGRDRLFLHCSGANDTYVADDLDLAALEGVSVFHFGYPPIMRRMYDDEGSELATLLKRVSQRVKLISLDTCSVDPSSEAGRVDWAVLLERVLPHVDCFVPSYDEIAFMLRTEVLPVPDLCQSALISERLLGYGAAVVALKLGEHGIYLRTSSNPDRLAATPLDESWLNREVYAPCFKATVVGTTGSGDCTIAGLLTGLVHGQRPEQAVTSATAVGACSVEAMDACSGVPSWSSVVQRIKNGWVRHRPSLMLDGWRPIDAGVFLGPNDNAS